MEQPVDSALRHGGAQQTLTLDSALRHGERSGTDTGQRSEARRNRSGTMGGQRSEARRNATLVLKVDSALRHGGMERTMPLDSTAGWRALKNEETGRCASERPNH